MERVSKNCGFCRGEVSAHMGEEKVLVMVVEGLHAYEVYEEYVDMCARDDLVACVLSCLLFFCACPLPLPRSLHKILLQRRKTRELTRQAPGGCKYGNESGDRVGR
jgi:hypothetical protein